MATMQERIERHYTPEPNTGCWLWTAYVGTHGYGTIRDGSHMKKAHRIAYELYRGPIPRGAQLDHLCRVRSCVNPDHLEVVNHRTNVLRGVGPTAQNARKTHCKQGHLLEGRNVIQTKTGRQCRECTNISNLRYMRRMIAENPEKHREQSRLAMQKIRAKRKEGPF